ncbi:MAG: hypothetical protein CMJ18_03905 [Phycisphaeraceae bacterium]|nr:hypothetical protein [Phycisphaeraceae bacterium]
MNTHDMSTVVSNEPKPGKKYFTIHEANRAVPYVSRVADDISDRYQRAVRIRQQIEHPDPADSLDELREQYEMLMDELNEFIDELALVGVELKDFERGLIDFPALHERREVYLCWQRGEDAILAWHEIDSGFSGRQDASLLA